MEDESKPNEVQSDKPASDLNNEATILEEYQKLKASSVSREQYEADLKAEKERSALYLKAITEGGKVDTPTDNNSESLQEGIVKMSKFKGTNLEYWQKMTPLIDRVIKEVPQSEITKVTGQDGLEGMIRVNEGMKKLVKQSDGDPDTFKTLYKRYVNDSSPKISADIESAGGLVSYLQKNRK